MILAQTKITACFLAYALGIPPIDDKTVQPEETPIQHPEDEIQTQESPMDSSQDPSQSATEPQDTTQINQAQTGELYQQGLNSYEAGNYPQAILLWEQAWQFTQEPTLLYHLGRAYWKRYAVEPNKQFLYRSRKFFTDYEQLAHKQPEYNAQEIVNYISAIDAKIRTPEQIELRTGSPQAERRRKHEQQTTTALRASGTTAIVLGSLSVGLLIAGLAMRGTTGFILDSSGGAEEGRPNFNSAESDARQRKLYQLGGKLAVAGIITTAILLPTGIGLRVTGDIRKRKDERKEKLQFSVSSSSVHINF